MSRLWPDPDHGLTQTMLSLGLTQTMLSLGLTLDELMRASLTVSALPQRLLTFVCPNE